MPRAAVTRLDIVHNAIANLAYVRKLARDLQRTGPHSPWRE